VSVGIVAISTLAVVAIGIGIVLAIAFAAAFVVLARRGRAERPPDIPAGMRPGPSDDMLERRFVERFIGWNLLFVLFFAAWIPVVWFREPDVNASEAVELTERSISRGQGWFAVPDEANPTGFACAQCHGPQAEGGLVPFRGEAYPAPALTDVCGRLTLDEIRTVIEEGREGTPMPSWSIRFAGPMNDQQIDDLLNFILTIQEIPEEDNLCVSPTAEAEGDGGGGGEA
jgi:mono/diheme cytochrome c family protein